jgi:hypothetical protein
VIYTYDAVSVPEPGIYGSAMGATAMVFGIAGIALNRSASRKGKLA